MKIYIIDSDISKLRYTELYFSGESDVICVCSTLSDFLSSTKVDCIVSPANSFGLMDGGYDLAITDYFGDDLQKSVQEYIYNNYFGEQPLGTSFIIDIPDHTYKLIHTPTMRTPSAIIDSTLIYHCTRSALICAKQNDVKGIILPLFGGGCGNVHPKTIAEMMWKAYVQIKKCPKIIDWDCISELKIREEWYVK